MEMVSAAKLRRAQTVVESARPYATDLSAVLANLAEASDDVGHPAFVKREVRNRAIILVTSDRGLAGAFNANLIRAAEDRMRERPQPTRLVLLGKKAFDYFRRRNAPVQVCYPAYNRRRPARWPPTTRGSWTRWI